MGPGLDFNGCPTLFATEVFAIEPGKHEEEQPYQTILYEDADVMVMAKPSGMTAHAEVRHRHQRGTALKVDDAHLVAAPETDISGLAVYGLRACTGPVVQSRAYLVLVAGAPTNGVCSAQLRPKHDQPLEDVETSFEVLWQGSDIALIFARVKGRELTGQVRRHLHILGTPVCGDRKCGNSRASISARQICGLAKPWCHLARLELSVDSMTLRCDCALPADLLKVLCTLRCPIEVPVTSHRVAREERQYALLDAFVSHEHGLTLQAYVRHACARARRQALADTRNKNEAASMMWPYLTI